LKSPIEYYKKVTSNDTLMKNQAKIRRYHPWLPGKDIIIYWEGDEPKAKLLKELLKENK